MTIHCPHCKAELVLPPPDAVSTAAMTEAEPDIIPREVTAATVVIVPTSGSLGQANSIEIPEVDLDKLLAINLTKNYFALWPAKIHVCIGSPEGRILASIHLPHKVKHTGGASVSVPLFTRENTGTTSLFLRYDGPTKRKGCPGSVNVSRIELVSSAEKQGYVDAVRSYAKSGSTEAGVLRAFYALQESKARRFVPDGDRGAAFWSWLKSDRVAYSALMSGNPHTNGLTSPATVRAVHKIWEWDTERVGTPEFMVGFAYGCHEIGKIGGNDLAMFHFGNVCAHKSWYAFRMVSLFGSPSFRFSERNHAYPVNVLGSRGKYVYRAQHSYGRTGGRTIRVAGRRSATRPTRSNTLSGP